MSPLEFQPFAKMARLSRDIVITEKLDGTNAQILIVPQSQIGGITCSLAGAPFPFLVDDVDNGGLPVAILAGSRTRWVTTDSDNYGFARWVSENRKELAKLGPGRHFGEWWGAGIQRRYGLTEKRFSLFNAGRWVTSEFNIVAPLQQPEREIPPACCHVVPVLYSGPFNEEKINLTLFELRMGGSAAAPGFRDPEGIVIYHEASKTCFKKTIKDDESPKSLTKS